MTAIINLVYIANRKNILTILKYLTCTISTEINLMNIAVSICRIRDKENELIMLKLQVKV